MNLCSSALRNIHFPFLLLYYQSYEKNYNHSSLKSHLSSISFLDLLEPCVIFWPSSRPKMPFKVMHRKEVTHSNGSYERKSRRWARLIIWDKVKVPLQSDAPGESDLWTAWQLFPLDDDQTCHSKDWVGDWVGVELLYNSVKTEVRQLELELELERRDMVGKATPGRRGPWSPWWVGVQRSCW